MAQQQIITKPYVGELQDNDSLFINHDGALRQVSREDADLASAEDLAAEAQARQQFEASETAARQAFQTSEVAARESFEESETEARREFEASINESISDLEEDLNEVVVAYKNIEPYLYAKDKYINADGVLTPLTGYDTYKIPLKPSDVLVMTWDSSPFGGISSTHIFKTEHTDGTLKNAWGQSIYGVAQSNYSDLIIMGEFPNISDVVAFYFTIETGNESLIHLAINRPFTTLINDVNSAEIITADNFPQSQWYYRAIAGNYWGRFSAPYNTKIVKMKAGDRIVIGKTITGVTYKALAVKEDTARFEILTNEYTASGNEIVYINDNSTVAGDICYYPANPLKISTDNILGDLNVNRQFDDLEGVAFGTSLTYRAITSYGYLTKLADLSGINFDNQGIGSSTIYGNMLQAIKNYTGYANKRMCVLEGFVNDWYGNVTLGVYTDTTESTACGCVRSALNYMLSQNANMTIFLILDHYGRNNGGVNCSTTAENGSGLTQYEYYEEIAKVAESLGIPVIKEYEVSQISENTPQYLADNIHMNALGAVQSAYAIWSQMKNYYPNQV